MKKMLKWGYLLVGVGLLCSLASVIILVCTESSLGQILGNLSTSISIVLGLISILYTYFSGEKTLETFNKMNDTVREIRAQNEKLVETINYHLSRENYDEQNIDSLRSDE